jgi:hypothetical protein
MNFVILQGIKKKNCFFTSYRDGEDPTKLYNGTTAYKILGYADSIKEAQDFLYNHMCPKGHDQNEP